MAQRFLALDWDLSQLHLAAGTLGKGGPKIERAMAVAEPGSPSRDEAAAQGARLRELIRQAGMPTGPLLVCVGRERVILKEIRFPPVPEHEEPQVVRFQAVKELTEAAEGYVIDYVRVDDGGPGERRAWVMILRKELLDAYQILAEAAGLRLAAIVPRTFGMAACLRGLIGTKVPAPENPGDAVALAAVGEKWAELCILKGDTVLLTRTLNVGPTLAGEIRRNLAVHAGQSPGNAVKALYLALSGEQAALRENLATSLEIPVHPFDPFGGADEPTLPQTGRGTFVGALGLLHLKSLAAPLPVNFVSPRQPRPPSDPKRRSHLLVAALTVVLVCSLVVMGKTALDNKQKEVAALKEEADKAELDLRNLRKEKVRKQALHEWSSIPFSDVLFDLSAMMPQTTATFSAQNLELQALRQGRVDPAKPAKATSTNPADLTREPAALLVLDLAVGYPRRRGGPRPAEGEDPAADAEDRVKNLKRELELDRARPEKGSGKSTENKYTLRYSLFKRTPDSWTRWIYPPENKGP